MSYYRSSSSDVPLGVYLIVLAVFLLFSSIPGCVKVTLAWREVLRRACKEEDDGEKSDRNDESSS